MNVVPTLVNYTTWTTCWNYLFKSKVAYTATQREWERERRWAASGTDVREIGGMGVKNQFYSWNLWRLCGMCVCVYEAVANESL